MSCITTETAMNASNYVLDQMIRCDCSRCAHEAFVEKMRRQALSRKGGCYASLLVEKRMKNNDTKMSSGQGQWVNAKPTVRTAHDLSFLISDKSGKSTPVVVKDVDSKTLHDMLDIADEIVISRVDAK